MRVRLLVLIVVLGTVALALGLFVLNSAGGSSGGADEGVEVLGTPYAVDDSTTCSNIISGPNAGGTACEIVDRLTPTAR